MLAFMLEMIENTERFLECLYTEENENKPFFSAGYNTIMSFQLGYTMFPGVISIGHFIEGKIQQSF